MSRAAGRQAMAHDGAGQTHRHHDGEEARGVDRPADERPPDLAHRDVADAHRRGQHRVVDVRVLELEEDVHRRVVDGAVHGGRGEEGGRDELGVADRLAADLDVADEGPQAEADRDQVEDRLEEPRQDDHVRPAVDVHVALDQAVAAAGAPQHGRQDAPAQGGPVGAQGHGHRGDLTRRSGGRGCGGRRGRRRPRGRPGTWRARPSARPARHRGPGRGTGSPRGRGA